MSTPDNNDSSIEWVIGPQNTSFFTKTYLPSSSPPTAAILFLHGFIEHVERYNPVFPLWSAKGIAVIAFDQRGFGKTATDKEHNKDNGYGGAYGKTSLDMQVEDVEFMVGWAREKVGKDVKLFLMGHSMGGGIAVTYCTRSPPKAGVKHLSGVIATSPLIKQTTPAPKWKRALGSLVQKLSPWSDVPAPVNAADLSHDPKIGEAYLKDPLVIQHGTLRGVSTMLKMGENLLEGEYKHWPNELPLLIVHGDADKVTSHDASSTLVNSIAAKDKAFRTYKGGYHELHNEPDGVREKLVGECVDWVRSHVPFSSGNNDIAALEDGVQQSKL